MGKPKPLGLWDEQEESMGTTETEFAECLFFFKASSFYTQRTSFLHSKHIL